MTAKSMKISMPYRHYYYLKILADLRRETISDAIRYLFNNFDESSDRWIEKRFAHFDRPVLEFRVDEDLLNVNIESVMKRLESLPSGIRPITDGPYETDVKFFEDDESQGIEILGYKICDFKKEVNWEKMSSIYALVKDKFPFEMTARQFEIYRRVGSQFWRLTQDRDRETMPLAGHTAMDVGAYVGQRALAMHYCTGKTGRVYAIEVEDENFKLLKKNAEINSFDNFIPIQEATDEIPRITQLYTRDSQSMSHGLRPFEDIEDPERLHGNQTMKSKEVQTKTLDQIFHEQGITHMDVIHISVTGHEIPVLKGMNALLPTLRTLRVSCPYKSNGIPNIDTAQEILEAKGFGNFSRHGAALICEKSA